MKKILVSMFLLVLALCSVGCENSEKYIVLQTHTHEVQNDIYENGCVKYNLGMNAESYYVISNYDDYLMFCSSAMAMKINPNKEELCYFFEEFVIFCYARSVSYSREFISVEYRYNENTNKINYFYTNNFSKDDYPCVEVAYCFDMVDVPKVIYEKILNISETNDEQTYKLTIQNDSSNELIGIKEEYKSGEEVEVKMEYDIAVETYVFLNGELLGTLNGSNSLKFDMPAKDSVLVLTYTNDEIYKINTIDNSNLLLVPLKQYYTPGDIVKVITIFLSGPKIDVQVDGQFLEVKEL